MKHFAARIIVSVLIAFLLVLAGCKNKLHQVPNQFDPRIKELKPVGKLADTTIIDLVIGLPLRNSDSLQTLLQNLNDPSSASFHKYLSPEKFRETFFPALADVKKLMDWITSKKLKVVMTAAGGKFVHVQADAGTIAKVFHVNFNQYKHPTEDRYFYAPDKDPSIDLNLTISHITGFDNYRLPVRQTNKYSQRPDSIRQAGGSGNFGLYTGNDFRAAYAGGVKNRGEGQVVGILEFRGYDINDIRVYEKQFGFPDVPVQNVYINGYTGTTLEVESAADLELVISMAPGIDKAVIYGAPYGNPGVNDILFEMANPSRGEPLPRQITTSYYFYYDQNVYDALAQFVMQGQTFCVASGDYNSFDEVTGAGAFPPADHPYVTSVGGTTLTTTGPAGSWTGEKVWRWYSRTGTGGGYSPWAGGDPQFLFPSWQTGIDLSLNGGSSTARNAPDVAMIAEQINVYAGSWQGFAGTSASSPLWAGFMALVNQEAANAGAPPIGFANPALYEIGLSRFYHQCFHDVTTGNNFSIANPEKYSAVPGYDLCTGWGSPIGLNLINNLVAWSLGNWKGDPISYKPIHVGDLNGDGKDDVFMWRNPTNTWTVNISTGSGFTQQEWTGAWGSDGPIRVSDLNGDKKTDVIMWRYSSNTWTVNISTGNGFTQQEWSGAWGSDGAIQVGDLNGDLKADVFMWRNKSKTWTVDISNGTGFSAQERTGTWGSDGPINTGDINGDGMTDIFIWRNKSKTWMINLSNATSFTTEEWPDGNWTLDGTLKTGDLNGDGKVDVFMWRKSTNSWLVNLSTGASFNQRNWAGAPGSNGPINVGDLNGDGKMDVFMWHDATKTWSVNISTGTGFVQSEWTGAWGSDGPINVGDLNGDGKIDVFMWDDRSKTWSVNLSTGTGFIQREWTGAWGSDGWL